MTSSVEKLWRGFAELVDAFDFGARCHPFQIAPVFGLWYERGGLEWDYRLICIPS